MDLDEGTEEQDLDQLLSAAEAPEGEDDDTPEAVARKANRILGDQIAAQQRELDELKGRVATRPYDTELERPAAPVTQPAQPPVDMEKLKAELSAMAISDPAGFALRIFDAANRNAQAMIDAKFATVATGTATNDVNQYRAERAARDPYFKESMEEFDKLVKQAEPGFVNLTPQQRKEQLDFLADTAYGRVERARKANGGRERTPPDIGGGSAIATGTRVEMTYKGQKLSKVQREVLRIAKESGITDPKRIKKMLEDSDE